MKKEETTTRPDLRQRFWATAERTACTLFRWALTVKSRNITDRVADGAALVLAPHADDETLGCGGIIAAKRRAGTDVVVAMATDGSASHRYEPSIATSREALVALRRQETLDACATLGLAADDVIFFDLPDGALDTVHDDLTDHIARLMAEHSPDEVYVCAITDGHPDHVALAKAVRAALGRQSDPQATLFEYPVWSFEFRSWRDPKGTNTTGFLSGLKSMMRVARTWHVQSIRLGNLRPVKADALAKHRSQLGTYPPEPQWSGLPAYFLRHFQGRYELFRRVERAEWMQPE